MGKTITHKDLICLSYVFNSHEDFSVIEELYAGFDNEFNLIILCEHTDYDEQSYNCATYAIVSKEEAYHLAQKLKVPLQSLPSEISKEMSEWGNIVCPTPRDVRDCFKELTECLIDEGCHLRIQRQESKNGFISC